MIQSCICKVTTTLYFKYTGVFSICRFPALLGKIVISPTTAKILSAGISRATFNLCVNKLRWKGLVSYYISKIKNRFLAGSSNRMGL